MNNNNAAVKYPRQTQDAYGNKVSFTMEDRLLAPRPESTTPPLEFHEGSLSRFVVTLLDWSSSKTIYVSANIPAKDVPGLVKKTDLCFMKGMMTAFFNMMSNNGEKKEECYTTVLPWGDYKGMTPASVLSERPDAADALLSMVSLLQQNLNRFPANATVIKSIEQAVEKCKAGTLDANATVGGSDITLVYERNFKFKGREMADGFRAIYGIRITHNASKEYPWNVRISNCEAPVEKKGDGTSNAIMSKSRNGQVVSINLSDDDWSYVEWRLTHNMEMFETAHCGELTERAETLERQNIEAARAAKK